MPPDPPTLDAVRHAAQRALLARGDELEVGSRAACPLPLPELLALRAGDAAVVETFEGGLTAVVHRLRLDGRDWSLKLARRPARVRNADGELSFLNELQRRSDFERLKSSSAVLPRGRFDAFVDTTYGSLHHGVLLSPWIEGEAVRTWDERRLQQVIDALLACAGAGLFEWDPSPGNLLDDGQRVRLFDFGYLYAHDPLRHFNSAGHGDDMPMFHPVERFETRTYFGVLLDIERGAGGRSAALDAFRTEKRIALDAYRRHRSELVARGASNAVRDWLDAIVQRWSSALAGDFDRLYLAEAWRSHVLDLYDDLGGRTCTPTTLRRTDWLLDALAHEHAALAAAGAFFGDDEFADRAALQGRYRLYRDEVVELLDRGDEP